MRIGSLFSGIGGLELGLEWAGVGHTVWQVEFNPFCRDVLAKHWPEVRRHNDVREVGAHNLEPVDVICGGYPCQPFSTAGKQLGEDDPRHLWPEFARILGELRPKYAVLENVRGHLSLGFGQVLGNLSDLGYDAEWSVVSACSVGAPHTRERVFILAHSTQFGCVGESQYHVTEESQESNNKARVENLRLCDGVPKSRGGGNQTKHPRKTEAWAAGEPESSRVVDGIPSRVDVAQVFALGNAVVPQVAEIVGRRLLDIHRGLSV